MKIIGTIALLVLAGCAAVPAATQVAPATQPPAQVASPAQAAETRTMAVRRGGFLTAETAPDAYATISPAPKAGEPRNDLDWAIFKATRVLEGSDRWKLAQEDNSYTIPYLLKAFSCSVGAELTPQNSPILASILARTTADAGTAAARAKDIYKRTRPYLHNAGNICIEKSDSLAASFDYPSGHASLGWTAGLVIAQLAPDRATPVLARARAYGESRAVCGVHNWTAVDAARTNAAGVFAALQGSAEFVSEMAKAKAELTAARASAPKPDAAACTKEAELVKPLEVK